MQKIQIMHNLKILLFSIIIFELLQEIKSLLHA